MKRIKPKTLDRIDKMVGAVAAWQEVRVALTIAGNDIESGCLERVEIKVQRKELADASIRSSFQLK